VDGIKGCKGEGINGGREGRREGRTGQRERGIRGVG
jgi:hypothetical protein